MSASAAAAKKLKQIKSQIKSRIQQTKRTKKVGSVLRPSRVGTENSVVIRKHFRVRNPVLAAGPIKFRSTGIVYRNPLAPRK